MQDFLDFSDSRYEPFRPLVTAWLAKIEGAISSPARKRWKEVSDECHDDQTEVLTDQGWRLFSSLQGDELLATVDLEKDLLEYQRPSRITARHVCGDMVRFKGKSLDALVTQGHRMVFFPPHSRVAGLKEAGEMLKSDQLKLTVANWEGELPVFPDFLNGVNPEDFAEWLGFYIAEGWCFGHKKKNGAAIYGVGIAQKKPHGCRYFERLSARMPFKTPPYQPNGRCYVLHHKKLWHYLREFGSDCYSKSVPDWVKKAPQSVIRAFLRGYIAGDGNVSPVNGQCVSATASPILADDLQELWLKVGQSASIRKRPPGPYTIAEPGKPVRSGWSGTLYLVTSWRAGKRASLKRHNGHEIQLMYHKEHYDGMVYCATVANGTLVTRRNGLPLISGNCLMFYNKSAAAMWDGDFTKKFWRGVKAPRFRVTINKAFEYVAIIGPNLLWDIPHRQVTPKKRLAIPQELIQADPRFQQVAQEYQMEMVVNRLRSEMMMGWLNYTSLELPNGGLGHHNEMAVLDAMLKGSGCLWPALYSFPGSERTLTGGFRKPPEDLIYDPDFKTAGQCKWMALRHLDPHWEVEKRFKLPPNSLKGKSRLESSWHFAETMGRQDKSGADRQAGKTNDLIVWYEVWSKMGVGSRMTGMPDALKGPLEELVGDYAYLCICPDCPYPLNCSSDFIRKGATPEAVRECFEWPVPLWTDSRWPVNQLVFYEDPDSPYGVPPLSPALGELKAINAIVSWLVNRTWQSSRQMWAVLGQYHDEMKKVLDEGDDQSVFALPPGVDQDIKKVIQLIEQKEVNKDAWQVLELLSDAFDKRTGLTESGAYGTEGTQSRTAEDVKAKQKAFGVRPEYMQKKVIAWQSQLASVEAMLAWMFIKGSDTKGLFGRSGSQLWDQFIANADHEEVVRELQFDISASSIRRPNRERDMENFAEYMGRWLPLVQGYGELTGDYGPANGAMARWGELHDMERMEELFFPQKDPNDPNAQLDQQLKQAEVQKVQAEAQKLQGEAQANPMAELQMEAQFKQQESDRKMAETQAKLEADIRKLEMELAMKQAELQMKAQEHQMDMQFKAAEGQQDLALKQQEGEVDMAVKKEQGAHDIALSRQQMQLQKQQGEQQMQQSDQQHKQAMKQGADATKAKVDSTKKTTDAKVQATKAMAKAKPKPAGGGK